MNNSNELRQSVWNTLSESTPGNLKAFKAIKLKSFGLRADTLKDSPVESFSLFNDEHIQQARKVWESFFSLADNVDKPETDAVGDAIEEYKRLRLIENPELLDYALMVFITHNDRARRVLNGSIPSILKREPQKVIPSAGNYFKVADSQEKEYSYYGGTTSADENKLCWYTEDPLLNEHHEHWHIVYPNGGINNKAKDRAGEMFIYMHQQMIARYEIERMAAGLNKVEPYNDFSKPIPVGYKVSEFVKELGDIMFSDREENWKIESLDYINVSEQMAFQKNLQIAIDKGYIEVNNKRIKLDANLLGMIIESTGVNVEKFNETKLLYGNVHNMGHMLIANSGKGRPYGIMSAPATNIKDTIFWRWHKSIDNLSFNWQERQKTNDFSDAPNVLIRKGYDWSPDIILCDLEDISTASVAEKKKPEELAEVLFGGEKWNSNFTNSQTSIETVHTLSSIKTEMKTGIIEIKDAGDVAYKVPYDYLSHQKIAYFIRLQNLSPIKSKVTVRVFLVPKTEVENRRMWIELDKFVESIEGDSKKVVFRKDMDASVIRKPAVTEPDLENIDYKPLSVDWRGMFSRGLKFFIASLIGLVSVEPDDDQSNEPDLIRYNKIYEEAKTDLANGTIDELTFNRRKAAFKNVLTRYLSNITIAWEEMKLVKYPTDLLVLKDEVEVLCTVANASQHSGSIEAYYSAVSSFLQNFHKLLKAAVGTVEKELNDAFMKAYDKIYNSSYCECGLPYTLLFPRGTEEGMDFYLMVMVTDWSKDIVGDENCCGSMSYCGAKDEYPDIREMGYPFNRPFADGILNTIGSQPNMACRTIKIISSSKKSTT